MGCATAPFFCPAPWGPWEGPKGQISFNIIKFQLQSQFQRFFNQTLCYLTHGRYKTYQTGFSFGRLGHAPGVGLRGTVGNLGVKNFFFLKFNQILCVSYLHEWHMRRHHFLGPHPLGPWGGAKRSNIVKSELQSQFQRFLNQTLYVFSQMKHILHIRRDFYSAAWVMPMGGTWGYRGGFGVKKNFSRNSTRFGV